MRDYPAQHPESSTRAPRQQPRPRAHRHRRSRQRAHASAATGFAWLRMIGALMVVIDHSGPLVDPSRLTAFPVEWRFSPGYFALMGFFAMSGFQIAESWARDPSVRLFAFKRALRIFPPLLTVLLCTALVIGPLFTVLPLGEYFAAEDTWSYILAGAGLFGLHHLLPGVFVDNPYPWSVNGSLWTLPMEVTGYVLVLCCGLLGIIARHRYLLFGVLGGILVFDAQFQATVGVAGGGGAVVRTPIGATTAFMVAFAIGVILFAYRDRLPLRGDAALVLVGCYAVAHLTPAGRFVLPFAAGYGAVVLAHRWPRRLAPYDLWVYGSYGLYIWAFPIQQMLIVAGLRDQWSLMAASVPLCYLAGLASWVGIERPTLALRGPAWLRPLRTSRSSQAAPSPAEPPPAARPARSSPAPSHGMPPWSEPARPHAQLGRPAGPAGPRPPPGGPPWAGPAWGGPAWGGPAWGGPAHVGPARSPAWRPVPAWSPHPPAPPHQHHPGPWSTGQAQPWPEPPPAMPPVAAPTRLPSTSWPSSPPESRR